MLTEEEFSVLFWSIRSWVQNGTYPDWPYSVYRFILEKNLRRIIEVGCGTGAVTVAIALTEPEVLIGIDDERENNLLEDVEKIVRQPFFWWFIGKSEEFLPTLQGPYDLLVHDGEHSYDSVTNDCREALRLGVRYIIVHDSDWPEVDKAIDHLGIPNWMLLQGSGYPRVLEVPCKA
jgi:precorrin-6B methylase 2